jgi:signal transduction histidine kinase
LDKLTPPTLEEFSADAYLATLGLPAVDEEVGTDRLRRLVTKTRNFAIVYQITKALSTAAQVDELLRKALDFILTVISASRGYMILRDPETGELVSAASTAQANEEEHTLKVSQTIIEWVIKERSAVISSDATTDQRFEDKKSIVLYDIRSVLCAPMMYGSRVVGVIQLDSVGVGSGFTEDDLDLITVIAPVLGVAIENTRLIEAQEKTIAELREAHNKLVSAQERLVAKERMALVGRITSGLAHEIRNLMSPFMLVDLLQEEYPEDENIGEYASLMIEAYGRIGSLVEEIRLLARGEQSQLQLASHSINETLESVVRFVRCDQEVRIHPITIDCEPVSPFVFDENRIKQVLINLIRNAVQSMDSKGAVSLKAGISADKPRFLRLVVTDEGEGIDTENLQRIWEPFFSTKERDGTGLGLHLCRGIVEQHGGSMACDSTPGVGTSMIVFLPIDLDPSGG